MNIDPVAVLVLRTLVALLFLETLVIMVMWTRTAPWWKWGAGRSVMILLGSLLVVFCLALIQILFGRFPGYVPVALASYVLLLLAIGKVGTTILQSQHRERKKKRNAAIESR